MKKLALAALLTLSATSAFAGAIVSATGAVIDVGTPGFGDIANTHNQAGLLTNYTSGVSNFDAFIGTNPQHSANFTGFEWFGSLRTNPVVTYDLGEVRVISAMALWNEEAAGIGLLNLFSSFDGTSFDSLISGLMPSNNPPGNYPAQVFAFAPTSLRYVRLEMGNCPVSPAGNMYCSIGEVAFEVADPIVSDVPEPMSLGLLGLGLAGLLAARRRA